MNKPLHIAIAGLGTVGGTALKILQENAALLEARSGRALKVVAVSARDKNKTRPASLAGIKWVDSPLELAAIAEVDVVVELIGGSEGIAKNLIEASLKAGKHVVTANKALIAHHGVALAKLAEEANVIFAYEAAVAGGIPVIKTLREGLAANRFTHIAGILNGTCNFILTSMWESHKDFAWALGEAQRIGYAEADPAFDVDGVDTAHKLAILTSLAYGCPPNIKAVHMEGIRNVTVRDMEFADQLGYTIKLLGQSSVTAQGILQRVHPCMVPKLSTIGRVGGPFNAIIIEGDSVGRITLEGAGAGAGATGSSVVGDILDIARGNSYKPFGIAAASMQKVPMATIDTLSRPYYARISVVDEPGVLAAVTGIFRDEGISLLSVLQHSPVPGEPVQVVLTTHETLESAMISALESVAQLESVIEPPHMIRIEPL
jgi:homoserine dehydrogenase